MERGMYEAVKGVALAGAAALILIFNPSVATGAIGKAPSSDGSQTESPWHEFHSVAGKCKMMFPGVPQHISEKMSLPGEGYDLKYDAYISPFDKQTVFMLLVAQYPEFVNESYAQVSLEGFLNGILQNHPSTQLIFADLSLVNGHEALDFFIRTGTVYFKGRALMVKNHLYLMAMECEMQTYDEGRFNHFINSFQFVQ